LNKKLRRSDFAASHDVFALYRHCARIAFEQQRKKSDAEFLFKEAIESESYLENGKVLSKLDIESKDIVSGRPIQVFPYYTDGSMLYNDQYTSMIEMFA
jgi:hypothetical protein